jgi:glutamate-1-semialdehyde aminotransferase
LEPVLGEGGFLTPPPGFMADLRSWADAHGILVIADEVGFGRVRRAGADQTPCRSGFLQGSTVCGSRSCGELS